MLYNFCTYSVLSEPVVNKYVASLLKNLENSSLLYEVQ